MITIIAFIAAILGVAAGWFIAVQLLPRKYSPQVSLEKNINDVKQVIVMRTKFPDGKGGTTSCRKGKMIAQGSHGSMAFMSEILQKAIDGFDVRYDITPEIEKWLQGSFAKICCQVETEEELIAIYEKAKKAGLNVHMITDSGRTEFKEPTKTCLAIGPHESKKIDVITGHLKLL